jgi:hypothetical protein
MSSGVIIILEMTCDSQALTSKTRFLLLFVWSVTIYLRFIPGSTVFILSEILFVTVFIPVLYIRYLK